MRNPVNILFATALLCFLACGEQPQSPSKATSEQSSLPQVDSFAYWNGILLRTPDDIPARAQRASAYIRKGADASAVEDYDHILAMHPRDRAALLHRAAAHMRLNNTDLALLDYAAATTGQLDRSLFFNAVAVQHIQKKDFQSAITALDTAIGMNPRMEEAWYNKGAALYELGKLGDAEYHFQMTLQINPNHSQAFSGLGLLFQYGRSDSTGAEWYYNKAVAADVENAVAWFGLGNLDMSAGRTESAIQRYDRALKADSTYADAWANRGLAYFRKGEYALSEQNYSAALRHDPDIAHVYAMRGLIRCESGKIFSGCADLEAALQRGVASAAKEIARYCK